MISIDSTSGARKYHFRALEILKAIAIIPIYCYHQWFADGAFYTWCVWGVTIFLMLSGFLNTVHGYDRDFEPGFGGSLRYALRKIRRLFPLHVIMLVIATASWLFSNRGQLLADIGRGIVTNVIRFILNLFLVSDWIPHLHILSDINGEYNIVTWFWSLCFLMYILTPFFVRCMHRLYAGRSRRLPYIVMAVILVYVVAFDLLMVRLMGTADSYWYVYECPLSRVGDYLIGMQLGYVFLEMKSGETSGASDGDMAGRSDRLTGSVGSGRYGMVVCFVCSLVISAILIILGTFVLDDAHFWLVSCGFYYTVPVGMLILSLSCMEMRASGPGVESPSSVKQDGVVLRILLGLGSLSAYEYLIHYPVINVVHGIYRRIADVNILIWFLISVSVTIAGAVIYKRLADRRSLHS